MCLFEGRICRRRIAIWFACIPPPVFGSVCLDRWAFRRLDLVRVFGLVHRRAIWLMPAGLVGRVECGRPEWRSHWLYSLLSWRSSWLVRQFLFRQLQPGIYRRLQHSVPSPLSWSWCWFVEAHQSWAVRRWWRWGWANDRWPVRQRLTSLIVVRCHWRPNWCRAKLTGNLSVAA